MFQKAYEVASAFTAPMVIGMRFLDGKVESGLGSFVVLNDEGWLITAAHNLSVSFAFNEHKPLIEEYQKKEKEINDSQLKPFQKKAALKLLKRDDKWLLDFIILLNGKKIDILEWHVYGELDIAFLRIDKGEVVQFKEFPKFKKIEAVKHGMSLCKLGFPFHDPKMTFDPAKSTWDMPVESRQIARFPIEGIYTREINMGKTQDGTKDKLFIETSSPGLKGQSGGPIVDVDGNICGIQSQNLTVDLGFKGKVKVNNKDVEENQFINLGIGVHPKAIIPLRDHHKIKYELVD